jgi:hypothetical protein
MFSRLKHDRTKPKSCHRAVLLNHYSNCTLLPSVRFMRCNTQTRYKFCRTRLSSNRLNMNLLERVRRCKFCRTLVSRNTNMLETVKWCTRWFKYDRDKLWLVYTQIIPVIFEPPCKFCTTLVSRNTNMLESVTRCKFCRTLLLGNTNLLETVRRCLYSPSSLWNVDSLLLFDESRSENKFTTREVSRTCNDNWNRRRTIIICFHNLGGHKFKFNIIHPVVFNKTYKYTLFRQHNTFDYLSARRMFRLTSFIIRVPHVP